MFWGWFEISVSALVSILLWSENILCVISVLLDLLRRVIHRTVLRGVSCVLMLLAGYFVSVSQSSLAVGVFASPESSGPVSLLLGEES